MLLKKCIKVKLRRNPSMQGLSEEIYGTLLFTLILIVKIQYSPIAVYHWADLGVLGGLKHLLPNFTMNKLGVGGTVQLRFIHIHRQ